MMEIEECPQVIAKRMWKIVRIVFYMLRKSLSKRKLMLDLQMIFRQGKLLGKSIENLLLQLQHQHQHHYAALTCRPDDVETSFISPREYEFSCSNTPIIHPKKRHHHHPRHRHHRRHHHHHHIHHVDNDVVEKVAQRLNLNYHDDDSFEASPLVLLPGLGGGNNPRVKQLRVTDSPFSIKEMEDDPQVDMDAEEFIKKFYMELNHQKRAASFESPSPCNNYFSRTYQ